MDFRAATHGDQVTSVNAIFRVHIAATEGQSSPKLDKHDTCAVLFDHLLPVQFAALFVFDGLAQATVGAERDQFTIGIFSHR